MTRATAAVRLLAGDKEPVRLASTANLALAGLLTLDGVVTEAGNRVLVKDQTDATENGIYTVSEGTWQRAPDANSPRVLIAEMKVAVQEGDTQEGDVWKLDTDRPDIGEDDIEWSFYINTDIIDDINAATDALVAQMDAIIATALAAGKATQAEAEAGTSNVGWMTPLRVAQGARNRFALARTYYVRKDGNDNNDGTANTSAAAWLTIQHAVDQISQRLDLGGKGLIIQVGDGTYVENIILPHFVGMGRLAQASAVIQGNAANHSAVIIDPASGSAITAVDTQTGWTIKNIQLNSTSAVTVNCDYKSSVFLDGIVLGGSPNIHVQATFAGAFIEFINNPYVVTGNCLAHASAVAGGQVVWQGGATCSFVGTPSVGATWLQIVGGVISCGAVFNGLVATGAGSKFTWNYGGTLRTSNDLNPNSVLPSGLTNGVVNIWPVQAGASYDSTRDTVKTNLQVAGRALHGDSNYTILAADAPFIQTSATLTAARTWTLPLSNSLVTGSLLTISDGGGINGANTLTIQRQGADTFVGIGVVANAITLSAAYSSITVRNDANGSWFLVGST